LDNVALAAAASTRARRRRACASQPAVTRAWGVIGHIVLGIAGALVGGFLANALGFGSAPRVVTWSTSSRSPWPSSALRSFS
jgi:hypothetical protein